MRSRVLMMSSCLYNVSLFGRHIWLYYQLYMLHFPLFSDLYFPISYIFLMDSVF